MIKKRIFKKVVGLFVTIVMMVAVIQIQTFAQNSFDSVTDYEIGETSTGVLSEDNDQNAYEFTLSQSGRINIKYNADNVESCYLRIYDEDGQEVWSEYVYWDSTTNQISYKNDVELTSGSYTFLVSKNAGEGSYRFALNFTSANETFKESQDAGNNNMREASTIDTSGKWQGQIAHNDETDYYTFDLGQSGRESIKFTADGIESCYLKIYDEDGQEIWSEYVYWDSTTKQISYKYDVELTTGKYYFLITKNSGYGFYDLSLTYNSANETFPEKQNGSDNSLKNANEITANRKYIGQLAHNDGIDTFTIDLQGINSIRFTADNIESCYLKFYDEDGQEVWSEYVYWDSATKQISYSDDVTLDRGKYYFTVSENYGYGSYTFDISNGRNITESEITVPMDAPTPSPAPNSSNNDTTTSFGSNVSSWAKEEVETAYENDLIPETIIGEDLTEYIDRAEFAAIAVQLYEEISGQTVKLTNSSFKDIYGNRNINSINKAYLLGITEGTTSTTFEPDVDITREQLATMLCRAIKKYSFEGWTLEKDNDYYMDTSGVSKFADDAEISDYAKPSVYYMAKFGIIKGVDDSHFAPKKSSTKQEAYGYGMATREQAVLMSLRIFKISDMFN